MQLESKTHKAVETSKSTAVLWLEPQTMKISHYIFPSNLCIIIVGSGRVPNQALYLKGNWVVGNELDLTCILEERPSGQWAMRERKLNHPTYLKGENDTGKWIPWKR